MQWADGREKRLRMLRPRPSTEGLFNEKSNAHVLSALTVNGNKITSTLQCPGIVVRIKGDDQQRCVLRAVTSHHQPCDAMPVLARGLRGLDFCQVYCGRMQKYNCTSREWNVQLVLCRHMVSDMTYPRVIWGLTKRP